MRIKFIEVTNFRGFSSVRVEFDAHSVIIGENNSSKSAVLKALDYFFENAPKVREHDFHNKNISEPIEIKVAFGDLTPSETIAFSSNLTGDALIVTRVLEFGNPKGGARFFVDRLTNPDFNAIREASNATEKRKLFNEIHEQYSMPKAASSGDVDSSLEKWEAENEDKLVISRSGFRGFTNVAAEQLKSKTSYVLVPALIDVSDELSQSSKSPTRELLSAISRQIFENNQKISALSKEVNEKYREIADPSQFVDFKNLGDTLTSLLERYYNDAGLAATWNLPEQVTIPVPTPDLLVLEGDALRPPNFVGHGLQRAIIITLLEYLAHRSGDESEEAQSATFDEPQSDIIIAIEEPEAFQHPTKQRLFAQVLRELSEGFNSSNGIRVQVILVSHNPLFIDLKRFNEIRHFSKDTDRNVVVRKSTIAECAKTTAGAFGYEPDPQIYGLGLHVLTPEIAEGFFARKVVLVEGVGDRAVLLGAYEAIGRNPLSDGIYIVSTDGKTKLDKPLVIFSSLGIGVYTILDNDYSAKKKKAAANISYNRAIQKLVGVKEPVDFPTGVEKQYAAFDGNLEKWFADQYGEAFVQARDEVAKKFALDPSECCKSPAAATALVKLLTSPTGSINPFNELIDAIDGI